MVDKNSELVSLYMLVTQLHTDAKEANNRKESGATDFYIEKYNLYLEKTKTFFSGGLSDTMKPLDKVIHKNRAMGGGGGSGAENAKMQEIVAALGQLLAYLFSKLPPKEQEHIGFIKN